MTTTLEQIEARDFSMAQAFYSEPFACRHFVVGSPFKAEATERAWAFAERTWGRPSKIHVYPRTYVAECRKLHAEGLAD